MNREFKLSFLEKLWYYLAVICTFGAVYTIKVVIKKALSERHDNN